MRKALLLALIIVSVLLGYSYAKDKLSQKLQKPKISLLKFALVADSHNENDLLAKALNQAKSENVSFVIGLGDWTNVGTVEELTDVKKVFDQAGLRYYLTAGDHDLWDSRNRGNGAFSNYRQVFGDPSHIIYKEAIQFVILDNSDIYLGISQNDWQELNSGLDNCKAFTVNNSKIKDQNSKLCFAFAHKTPFHPQSAHIMGEDSQDVAIQAKQLMELLEKKNVDGFFSGDLHFFARFNSPAQAVRMTTIGAVASERNFQGPKFAIVTVYSDYSWEVEDVGIK